MERAVHWGMTTDNRVSATAVTVVEGTTRETRPRLVIVGDAESIELWDTDARREWTVALSARVSDAFQAGDRDLAIALLECLSDSHFELLTPAQKRAVAS